MHTHPSFAFLLTLFFLLGANSVVANYDSTLAVLQSKLDTANSKSRIQIYLDLAKHVANNDPTQATDYLQEILIIAEKTNDSRAYAAAYSRMAQIDHQLGDMSKAIEHVNKAAIIYTELEDKRALAKELSNTGVYYERMGQDSMAMIKYNEVLALHEQGFVDSSLYANVLNNIAIVESLKARRTGNISHLFNAIEKYRIIGKIDRKHSGPLEIAKTYNNIGDAFNQIQFINGLSQYKDSALLYFRKSEALKKKMKNYDGLAYTYGNMALAFFVPGQLDSAKHYGDLCLQMANKASSGDATLMAYEALMEISAAGGNHLDAYRYARRFANFKDSLLDARTAKEIAAMQAKYDNERKEKENQILATQNSESKLELEKNKQERYILIGSVLLLIIGGGLGYAFLRQRQKTALEKESTNQQKLRFKAVIEAEEKERVRIAQELHDGLGQMLTAAKLNLEGLDETKESEEQTLVNNSITALDEAVVEVRNISHNMMPAGLIEYGLINAIEALTQKINASKLLSIQFTHSKNWNRLEQSIEIALYRVIQEVLNNMIKHAQAKNIFIQLEKKGDHINLVISDDGKGFDTGSINQSTGIGWKNVFSRLSLIEGKIDIDSSPGKGTTVNIDVLT